MSLANEWHLKEMQESEEAIIHDPMEKEYLFYKAVQSGNIAYITENLDSNSFRQNAGKGTLSKSPLTNIKYHFVVTTALITRNCVQAGMVQEQAYRLSDFYIQKMDDCKSIDQVCSYHRKMVLDFTTRMLNLQKTNTISKVVSKAIEYIYRNIGNRITIEDLAEEIQVSPSHLSRLFKAEMNTSVSDYIREKKVERAKNLLQFSEYDYIDIASYLSFSSQSHFISVFEKYTGMTPKKYRDTYHRSTWQTSTPD